MSDDAIYVISALMLGFFIGVLVTIRVFLSRKMIKRDHL